MEQTDLIYAHILNAQELGFRRGEPNKAGRYLYIAKNAAKLFPPLSATLLNDQVIIDVIPPDSDSIALTTFKFHNSKWVDNQENGRDEYRMYFNLDNDKNREFYEPGDIVLIRPFQNNDEIIYKLFRLTSIKNGADFTRVNKLIQKYSETRIHTHALIPSLELSFLNLSIPDSVDFSKRSAPEAVKKVVFEEPIFEERQNQLIKKTVRDANFRDFVMLFYNYQCALTGTGMMISYGNLYNLEAAHIIGVAQLGGNNPSNGLPLTRDLHWAFDLGFFTITPDYTALVHEKAMNSKYMQGIHNRKLILPEDSRALPNQESIDWHNKNVFGLFLRKSL